MTVAPQTLVLLSECCLSVTFTGWCLSKLALGGILPETLHSCHLKLHKSKFGLITHARAPSVGTSMCVCANSPVCGANASVSPGIQGVVSLNDLLRAVASGALIDKLLLCFIKNVNPAICCLWVFAIVQ